MNSTQPPTGANMGGFVADGVLAGLTGNNISTFYILFLELSLISEEFTYIRILTLLEGLVMRCFNTSSLPTLSTLALDFALFDGWHSCIPGPTGPNRLFVPFIFK